MATSSGVSIENETRKPEVTSEDNEEVCVLSCGAVDQLFSVPLPIEPFILVTLLKRIVCICCISLVLIFINSFFCNCF